MLILKRNRTSRLFLKYLL